MLKVTTGSAEGPAPPKLLAEAKSGENERTKAESSGLRKARLQRD